MSPSAATRGLHGRLSEPVDIASLVMARVLFGLLMLWMVVRYFAKGWIGEYWIELEFHFRYFGFDWVTPWPGEGMYWHFLALGILAVLVTFGLLYRAAPSSSASAIPTSSCWSRRVTSITPISSAWSTS